MEPRDNQGSQEDKLLQEHFKNLEVYNGVREQFDKGTWIVVHKQIPYHFKTENEAMGFKEHEFCLRRRIGYEIIEIG